MNARNLTIVLVALCLGISANAYAKKGGNSHSSSSPNTSHPTESHTESHTTGGTSLNISAGKNTGSKSDGTNTAPASTGNPNSDPQNTGLTRQQVAEEKQKALADAKLAQSIEQAAAEAQRKQLAEQAAANAAAAATAREAAISDQQREADALARQVREAAWIARCKIQPVMSDEAIATCREVMSRPAPKNFLPQDSN